MKPMTLNMSKLKKVGGDDKSSVFMHPDGHKMVIAHKPLSALHRKQIEKMPIHKMAGGGSVSATDYDNPSDYVKAVQGMDPSVSQGNATAKYYVDKANAEKDNAPLDPKKGESFADARERQSQERDIPNVSLGKLEPSQEGPRLASLNEFPQQVEAMDPQSPAKADTPAPAGPNIEADYAKGQKAIQEQADVSSQLSQKNAAIETDALAQKEKDAQAFKSNSDNILAHQQAFIDDYAKQHINPNHFMESYAENASVGQKIATGIGLLLGGFAAQYGRDGRNPAADMIQNQINRDIDSQKANIENKKTLMGANQAMLHDSVMAENMTRMNLNDIYSHKIQQAAAQLGTQQAKANADAMSSKFAMENAQIRQQMAMRATVLGGIKNGTASPESMIPVMIPEAHQKDAMKELSQAKHAINTKQFLMDQFDKAAKENTMMRTGGGHLRTPPSIIAMNGNELPLIHDLEGRVNEFEQKTLQSLHPQPGDLDSKVADKRIAYEKFLSGKEDTPTLNAYIPGFSDRLKPKEAPQIKTVNGVRYMRGPNGQAIRVK